MTKVQGCGSVGVGHEAEVPDTDKTFREQMEQESANELVGGDRYRFLFVAVSVIPPTERDVAAIKAE
jgi:hypothetical protein